jgi:phosphoketolase
MITGFWAIAGVGLLGGLVSSLTEGSLKSAYALVHAYGAAFDNPELHSG